MLSVLFCLAGALCYLSFVDPNDNLRIRLNATCAVQSHDRWYAPPFIRPPTPTRVFSGVGEWGCIEFSPVTLVCSLLYVGMNLREMLLRRSASSKEGTRRAVRVMLAMERAR